MTSVCSAYRSSRAAEGKEGDVQRSWTRHLSKGFPIERRDRSPAVTATYAAWEERGCLLALCGDCLC